MACHVGMDVGAVSIQAAVLADRSVDQRLSQASEQCVLTRLRACEDGSALWVSAYRRTRGRAIESATRLLDEIIALIGGDDITALAVAGSGADVVARKLGVEQVNEFKMIAHAAGLLIPEAPTIFEIGGETSKFLHLAPQTDGSAGIVDYQTNGDCAAGTGSFLDQQAARLHYDVEDIGSIVASTDRAAQIAGRCSVFAKSDMIHAQQRGYMPPEVLRGLCEAVARNFRSVVVRSRRIELPVAFIGGVAANTAVVEALRKVFNADAAQLLVPPGHAHFVAIGAALAAAARRNGVGVKYVADLRAARHTGGDDMAVAPPLSMSRVTLLRDQVEPYDLSVKGKPVDGYLGIDVGSVSTNLAVIDDAGSVIKQIYTRTLGRPIEVVSRYLLEIRDALGDRVRICGVGTTGSGRELIGELIGADTVTDEITCHKAGACFIGETMLGKIPDTIFEIGGQDSKFISLEDGIVVDFTMNDACAAGTGSFLEERAQELDIPIKGKFAELALASDAPIRLGERCTVFMERDVNSCLQRGATKADLCAGLAYSIVQNYVNRVVRGRKIGDCIFFQGGTAYNDAVAAAFASLLDKDIIIPPHNGVLGAIGAALVAREEVVHRASIGHADEAAARVDRPDAPALRSTPLVNIELPKAPLSRFRGYDLDKVDRQLREFTCKGCTNQCQIQQFTVEGEASYWGDKCSDRYRKRAKTSQKPVIPDLEALRRELLLDDDSLPKVADSAPTVGIPLALYAYEMLPFYRTLFAHCGLRTVLSEPTNRRIVAAGLDAVVAEPCFPITVAHGHVAELLGREVDYVFLPNMFNAATQWLDSESHFCPWGQTLPYIVRRSPAFADWPSQRWLSPVLRFREGIKDVQKAFRRMGGRLGIAARRMNEAVWRAYRAQSQFTAALHSAGAAALTKLAEEDKCGIVITGRPYNMYDPGVSLSVMRKMREYYGVNVIPMDFIDVDDIDIRDIDDNMYWSYGRKILAVAKVVGQHANLDLVHITNFKCGPDSFIRQFIRTASGKPYLTLQFDGHSNDAGVMTRCEAYLDSKGILRPWQRQKPQQHQQQAPLRAAHSTSRG